MGGVRLRQYSPLCKGSSVAVCVVRVGDVRVSVPHRRMAVQVAVFAFGHRLVEVIVMVVIVPMRVFMLEFLVFVLMAMQLGKMQHHSGQHERPADDH